MNRGQATALSGWSLAPNQVSPGLGLTSLVGLGGRSDRQGGGAVHGSLRPQKVRQPLTEGPERKQRALTVVCVKESVGEPDASSDPTSLSFTKK